MLRRCESTQTESPQGEDGRTVGRAFCGVAFSVALGSASQLAMATDGRQTPARAGFWGQVEAFGYGTPTASVQQRPISGRSGLVVVDRPTALAVMAASEARIHRVEWTGEWRRRVMIRDPVMLLLSVPGLLLALTFHELAHGYVADALGDPTPRASGRLSLNPVAHLDLVGTLMLLLFRFGWAKPVPINPMYFRDRDRGLLLTGLAGPVSNVVMACLAMYVLLQFPSLRFSTAGTMVSFFFLYNIWLAVFNMLPIPPLDGSRVLSALVPHGSSFRRILYQLEQYGWLILMLLVLTRTISAIMLPAAAALERFIVFVVRPLVM